MDVSRCLVASALTSWSGSAALFIMEDRTGFSECDGTALLSVTEGALEGWSFPGADSSPGSRGRGASSKLSMTETIVWIKRDQVRL